MLVNGIKIDPTPIVEYIKGGEKIKAVQHVMSKTGASLKEAHDAVKIEAEKYKFVTFRSPAENEPPLRGNKTLDFKYHNWLLDYFCTIGMFVVCFGIPPAIFIVAVKWLDSGISLGDWGGALILVGFLIWSICSGLIAGYLSAIVMERDGKAVFRDAKLELILAKQNIQMKYDEVVKIEYVKIVGSEDGWSFLPTGRLAVHLSDGRKIKISSSRHEARKKKREHGLLWKYKLNKLNKDSSAPVPDVLLWQVCSELSKRTGQAVYLDTVIESSG